MNSTLNHIAVIMDGNRRWAQQNNTTITTAYKKGIEAARLFISNAIQMKVKNVTLYCFSSENWNRPTNEVNILMQLIYSYLVNDQAFLQKNNINCQFIGDMTKLSQPITSVIQKISDNTQNNTQMNLNIALSYGGREEIINACQKVIDAGIKNITKDSFEQFLYNPNMPNVDLLIRTSGVLRTSNFLLWQSFYAELYFAETLWPDFNTLNFQEAITEYHARERNFGANAENTASTTSASTTSASTA